MFIVVYFINILFPTPILFGFYRLIATIFTTGKLSVSHPPNQAVKGYVLWISLISYLFVLALGQYFLWDYIQFSDPEEWTEQGNSNNFNDIIALGLMGLNAVFSIGIACIIYTYLQRRTNCTP